VIATSLLTNFDFRMFAPERFGQVFNDMAEHLVHFDWTIDPGIIQYEGFVINGHVTSYFGIFPALLRMPFVLMGQGDRYYSRVSCIAALALFVYCNLRLAARLAEGRPVAAGRPSLPTLWKVTLVASGAQIYALASAWVYNEPEFWAAALAAAFNLLALKNYAAQQWPEGRTLVALAIVAGLALLTRTPEGISLLAAMALFLFVAARKSYAPGMGGFRWAAMAATVCAVSVAMAAIVNAGRWGNPLAFSPPMEKQIAVATDPHRREVISKVGPIQASRVPFAALYYLTGLPVQAPFVGFEREHYDVIEGPRIPMLLACPVPLLLAFWGLLAIAPGWPQQRLLAGGLVAAQSLTIAAVFAVPWLTLRYTIDFSGAIGALAAIGFHESFGKPLPRSWRAALVLLTVLGIGTSLATLVRYKISNDGVPANVRLAVSERVRTWVCPNSTPTGTEASNPPVITPSCPPMW